MGAVPRRRTPTAALLVPALAAGAVTAGGCGGASGPPKDLTKASAAQILQAAADAVGKVHSFHIAGTIQDADGTTTITADVTDAGGISATYADRDGTHAIIVARGRAYVKADRRFWLSGRAPTAATRKLAALLGGRWVKLPAARSAAIAKDLEHLLPRELAHCLPHGVGTLTKVGVRTEGGRPVMVIRDAGDVPGGAPGLLSVPLHGRILPLREQQTGPARAGGTFDPRCDDKEDTSTSSNATLSEYDAVPPVTPPADALDLEHLPQQPPGGGIGLGGGLSA